MKNLALIIWVCALSALSPARAQTTVWTYHNNNFRTGANTNETVLTSANVNTNTFGKLFSYAVDGYVYTQPLYVPGVNVPGRGLHNVFFVATEHNTVYAFDADSAGAAGGLLWKTNLGPAAVTTIAGVFTNKNFGARYNNGAFLDIVPEVGITGTPVIDTNTGTLYVDAFTGELGGGVTNYFHRLHALKISDGTEQPYSPVVVAASSAGTGEDSTNGRVYFNAQQQLQRSALTLAGGVVYVAYASYADTDPFHGWVLGFRATNLLQLTNHVFNVTPNSTVAGFGQNAGEGGIWMGGGGLAVDASTNLYFETGNGSFSATNGAGGTEYGDSFIKLSTAGGLSVADYFTPYNQEVMQGADIDLGSSGVVLLPDQPVNTHVLIGAGKEGKIYVLNRDQLTTGNNHFNANGSSDAVLQTDASRLNFHGAFSTPAYFNGCIFLAAAGDNLKSVPLANGLLSATTLTDTARTFSFPGATPSISANGTNNGIVWAIRRANPAILVACNAGTMAEIYTSTNMGSRDQLANGVKFAVPTVADGKVFVGNSNSVSVFGLLGATNASTNAILVFDSASYSIAETNSPAVIGVTRLGSTNGGVVAMFQTVGGGTAVDGVNYVSSSGTMNFGDGAGGTWYFTVPILNDNVAAGNRTVNLTITIQSGNVVLGSPSTAVLTIVDTQASSSSPTATWRAVHFGIFSNTPAVSGDTADPDRDGIANLMEYATGTDPNVFNFKPLSGSLAAGKFQLQFPRNTFATDIALVVQTATALPAWGNLMTWTNGGWQTNSPGLSVSESGSFGVAPDSYVNVTLQSLTNAAATGAGPKFYRLKINR